jgi:Flp pilus assembly protein TadG
MWRIHPETGRSHETIGVRPRIPGLRETEAKSLLEFGFHGQSEKKMKNLREESGQAVVFVAVFMGLLALGFLAFALDVGTLFREKRMAQSAAQAAAVAAAEEVGTNHSANEQAIANAMAKLNGFDTTLATNPATVTLTTPATGNFAGSYVQATVSMPIRTLFMGAFAHGMATVPVSATAIAGGGIYSQTCVCVTGNFTLSGGSTLNANGCGFFDNSSANNSIQVSGGSTIDAISMAAASTGWYPGITGGGDHINVPAADIVQGVNSTCTAVTPTVPTFNPANCLNNPGGSYGTYTFGPPNSSGTICYKALTVGANGSTCTLNPGVYVIYGGQLHFTGNPNLGGNGVFFYLTNGASMVVDGGANVNLVSGGATEQGGGTAPSLGAYNGILIYQDPSDSSAITFSGGASAFINGGIIAPNSFVTIDGGSGATDLQGGISVKSLTISGGGTVKALVDTNEGTLTILNAKPKLVQ